MEHRPHIGIIGEGPVGTALAEGLRRAGYEVETSGHDSERVERVAAASDTIILAVPHAERKNVVKEMGKDHRGKKIIDVSNAVGPEMSFAGNPRKSSAEELQGWLQDAKVVKAFNTVFARDMTEGRIEGEPRAALVAGDDPAARQQVKELAPAIGFPPADAGPLENARWLEAPGYLNLRMAYQDPKVGPDFGFKLLSHHHGA